MLHRIEINNVSGIPVKSIERFLSTLKKFNYDVISLNELIHYLEDPKYIIKNKVMFTMDDGYLDQIEHGVPVFQKYKCPVTIAVITNFISGKIWPWDAKVRYIFESTNAKEFKYKINDEDVVGIGLSSVNRLSIMRDVREKFKKVLPINMRNNLEYLAESLNVVLPEDAPENYRAFNWNDIKRLEGEYVNFVPHTQNHLILSNLDIDDARSEIVGSIEDIKNHIQPEPAFIFPNGKISDFNQQHIDILIENEVRIAFSTDSSYYSVYEGDSRMLDKYKIPRLDFPSNKTTQNAILSKMDYLYDAYNNKKLSVLLENAYGIKRTILSSVVQNYLYGYVHKLSQSIDSGKIRRIVFICEGNICRSPFAEIVASTIQKNIPVLSMGLSASGKDSPDKLAQKVAMEYGYDMSSHCSTRFDEEQIEEGDLLVVMEIYQYKLLVDTVINKRCQLVLLGSWDNPKNIVIADPFGRSVSRFRKIFSHIKYSVENLLSNLCADEKR